MRSDCGFPMCSLRKSVWRGLSRKLLCSFARPDLEAESFGFLQMSNDLKEIARLGIPGRSKHSEQAFFWNGSSLGKLGIAHCRFYVIAQKGLCRIEVSGEEVFDSFPQQFSPENAVPLNPVLNGFSKGARKWHLCSYSFLLVREDFL